MKPSKPVSLLELFRDLEKPKFWTLNARTCLNAQISRGVAPVPEQTVVFEATVIQWTAVALPISYGVMMLLALKLQIRW